MTSKVIQGHIRPLICQNHDIMKICMDVNIMKTQFFNKCHFYVIEKFFAFYDFILKIKSYSFTSSFSLVDSVNRFFNIQSNYSLRSVLLSVACAGFILAGAKKLSAPPAEFDSAPGAE